MRSIPTVCCTVAVWVAFVQALVAAQPDDNSRPVLRVVYFTPTDRQPESDRVARLDRIMTEIRQFYREGMKANGYGDLTFELDRTPAGTLRVRDIRGKEPMRAYGRNAAGKVRAEVKAALAADGLDADRETVIIFQQLLDWKDGKAIEVGPYVGGGGPRSGTAWVFDDAKLDPRLLASREPGGYYVSGPCSLGVFNTHYLGGVAHELGHALGLPHERESDKDRPRKGLSLMGGGNHTYGREQRGEGPGAFLTAASALPLSVHPLFTGKRVPPAAVSARLADMNAEAGIGTITLSGQLPGGPRVVGLVAFSDPQDVAGDYDSLTGTCPVGADGRFRVTIGDLKPGDHHLRLVAYGASGDSRSFAFPYRVGRDRRPDVTPFVEGTRLLDAQAAFRRRDAKALEELATQVRKQSRAESDLPRKVEHFKSLLSPAPQKDLASLPARVTEVAIADLRLDAKVGWGRPLQNQVLPDGDASVLLEVGGQFFASGLYAHAPARHALPLRGEWKTLITQYGLQDGHAGSVVFVVVGDGKELFRSLPVRDRKVRKQTVNVSGVLMLELRVEDAGDGASSDWAVWLEPRLKR